MSSSAAKTIGILLLVLLIVGAVGAVRYFWYFPHGIFNGITRGFHNIHFDRAFWGWPAFGLGVAGLFGLAFLFIWIVLVVWVYRDAEKRGMNAIVWALIVFFAHVIGLLVYFLVRSDHPIVATGSGVPAPGCPRCGKPAGHEHAFCPHCGEKLRPACSKCGTEVQPGWKACPHCGEKL